MNSIIGLTIEHLYMVSLSIICATIIATPLAIVVYKKNLGVNKLLYIVSLLQSFPALGMFALLVPLMGIGMKTVIFSLILYALLPIFQGTVLALKGINPEYYEIIEALNIKGKETFWKIEFPLILPNIISGIKLATIYTISFATIGTLVGAGGLGDLIYLGLQSMNIQTTLTGIIPLLLLTIITNFIFDQLEKLYYPADYKALINKVNSGKRYE